MHAPVEAVARGRGEDLVFLRVVEILHLEPRLRFAERRLRQHALPVGLERPEVMLEPGHQRDVPHRSGRPQRIEQMAHHRRIDADVLRLAGLARPGGDEDVARREAGQRLPMMPVAPTTSACWVLSHARCLRMQCAYLRCVAHRRCPIGGLPPREIACPAACRPAGGAHASSTSVRARHRKRGLCASTSSSALAPTLTLFGAIALFLIRQPVRRRVLRRRWRRLVLLRLSDAVGCLGNRHAASP